MAEGQINRDRLSVLQSYGKNWKFISAILSTDSLADTSKEARAALFNFEKTLESAIRSMYVEFMREYQSLNHMKLVINFKIWRYYILHLPVLLRPDSSTIKFRAVFNTSTKNNSGVSLNEVHPELFDILLKFQTYRVAFPADISKTYRQISVHRDTIYHFNLLLEWSPERFD